MRCLLLALLVLASCGPAADAPSGSGAAELPQPSGPPLAQQVDSVPSSSPPQGVAAWESAASAEGMALRLTEPGGRVLLSIACLGSPARIVVTAPRFSPIGSEDRFALGLGEEPVTLVADPSRQGEAGVTAEGPVPEAFAALLGEAEQVSALYGTQKIGPVAAPDERLGEGLAKSCTGPK